jgi:serine/threonine protein kinase/Tfp pilus assembly protein PilF
MAAQAAGQDTLIGQTLGHYRIVEKIGAGGMGEVYRARDEHLDRDAAIKVLPPQTFADEPARKRFRKEALALSKLNHPNIATIYDFDTQNELDFLVMEYIRGVPLSQRIRARPLPEKKVIALGMQLAEGLSAAHEHGVVHRDLKPGNLRLTDQERLKILDFGLAKLRLPVTSSATTESLSETETMAGTLPYMAPEQLQGGDIDARTDIHSAGALLYEMATGQHPFAEVERSQLIGAILNRPPRPPTTLNPRLSPEVERIIGKCLEKEPENRYQSAKELAIDLRRLQTGVLSAVQPAARAAKWSAAKSAGLGLGILVSVIVLLIAFNVGGWRQHLLGRAGARRIESLAVLPLENLSRDPEQEYFADGMTEELTADLSKISALRVISRTSAMHYKRTTKTLPEIARELNVDAVVEGSVRRSGDQVRITAQLIYGPSDRHLWVQNYERSLGDVLALESEVATAIANQIKIEVTPQERMRLAGARSVNPEAHEAYLKGRYFWNKRDRESIMTGLKYFQQAIDMDPTYALAYTGMADSYLILGSYFWLSPPEAFPKAKGAALKALEIDGTLAEVHTSMIWANELNWDWRAAEMESRRALDLDPSYATAHQWYSGLLTLMGRNEEAIAESRRSAELDPLSAIIALHAAQTYYYARRFTQARQGMQRILDISPDFVLARNYLGIIDVADGRIPEGIEELQKAVTFSPGDDEDATLGYAYALAGKEGDAQAVINNLIKQSRGRYLSPYYVALVYVGLGKKDQAFEWLEEAYKQRARELPWMRVDPMFDSLRSDPRFRDLLSRMNLPPLEG